VFVKPEDGKAESEDGKAESQDVKSEDAAVCLCVESVNPTLLIKNSRSGSRLVTAFRDVGCYSKSQPSSMPCVESILRTIVGWSNIIVFDLSQAFVQIPLTKHSVK